MCITGGKSRKISHHRELVVEHLHVFGRPRSRKWDDLHTSSSSQERHWLEHLRQLNKLGLSGSNYFCEGDSPLNRKYHHLFLIMLHSKPQVQSSCSIVHFLLCKSYTSGVEKELPGLRTTLTTSAIDIPASAQTHSLKSKGKKQCNIFFTFKLLF